MGWMINSGAGQGAGEKGLAASGRAHEQDVMDDRPSRLGLIWRDLASGKQEVWLSSPFNWTVLRTPVNSSAPKGIMYIRIIPKARE